jgi:hypothetical protein
MTFKIPLKYIPKKDISKIQKQKSKIYTIKHAIQDSQKIKAQEKNDSIYRKLLIEYEQRWQLEKKSATDSQFSKNN